MCYIVVLFSFYSTLPVLLPLYHLFFFNSVKPTPFSPTLSLLFLFLLITPFLPPPSSPPTLLFFNSSNILLDRHLTPKLSDFGLARESLNRPTHVTTVSANSRVAMGTVAYMAPEFLRNSKPSSKTDVYAFGVVILELFTGQAADDPSRDIRTLVSEHITYSVLQCDCK